MNELLCVQNYDCKNNFCFYENTSGFMFLQLKDTSNLIKSRLKQLYTIA